MAYQVGKFPIIKKENLAKNTFSYDVLCPEIASVAVPGQFAHIAAEGFMLRRPISICEVDRKKGSLRFVFEIRGEGTKALGKLNEQDCMDMIAPLGKGFTILDSFKNVVVVGGGIGVPPLLEVAKKYGSNATAIIGYRSANAIILEEDFIQAGVGTVVCTDDGTYGKQGFVTQALEEYLECNAVDMVYTCGPAPMLKGVVAISDRYGIPCEVSLEERMGCGVGACLVCACKAVKNGKEYMTHVCKDGPVFSSKEVVL